MSSTKLLVAGAALALSAGIAQASNLVVCTEASPENLNPQYTSSNTSYDVAAQIYNRLVELERGGTRLVPGLAESWEVSDDGMEWTFKLRHGVQWQSNDAFTPSRPFNADDVLYTYNRMADPEHPLHTAGGNTYRYFGLLEPFVERVEKVDDHTVKYIMAKPLQALPSVLTAEPMSILSEEYAELMLAAGTPAKTSTNPIGTGAFSIIDYRKDAFVRMKVFDNHWAREAGQEDRIAQVDRLIFSITPDPTVRAAKLRAGECHIVRLATPTDLPALEAEGNIELIKTAAANFGYLALNNEKEPFNDKRVREAIIHAIDRQAIIDTVFQGTGQLPGALIPPVLWGHHDGLKPRAYDPERARELLAEAGFPDGFSTTMWAIPVTRGYMPDGRRAAEMMQADLRKVGIDAEILTYEWGEYLKRARAGEHEMAMLGYTWDYPDPGQIPYAGFTCHRIEPGTNRARWCNPEYDEAFEKGNAAEDIEERTRLYRRGQEIFHEDAPVVNLANGLVIDPVRKEVKNYKVHVFGGQPFFGTSLSE